MLYKIADFTVKQNVFAAPRGNFYFIFAYEVVYHVRINARGVHDVFCVDFAFIGYYGIAAVGFFNVFYFGKKTKLHAVCRRVFCKCNSHAERADDARGLRVQRRDDLAGDRRFKLPRLVAGDHG